jgi:hypothetical protein
MTTTCEAEFLGGEAVQRRIRDEYLAPLDQLAHLGEPDALVEPLLDDLTVLFAAAARVVDAMTRVADATTTRA